MTKNANTDTNDTTERAATTATNDAGDLGHLSVLISGASVAGPALALNLARLGARVTVVEKAPELRGGGFAVDFRGHVHRRVLTAMGLWDEIHARQTHMGRQTVVDADGSPRVDLPAELMSGDVEIFRGDLAEIMYERTSTTSSTSSATRSPRSRRPRRAWTSPSSRALPAASTWSSARTVCTPTPVGSSSATSPASCASSTTTWQASTYPTIWA